ASFGITLLEAMACGTPLVVSDIVGFRELIDGGQEAVLVPADDPGAWSRTVIELLSDPQRRAQMGQAGLAKAERYTWPDVAERTLQIYRRGFFGGRFWVGGGPGAPVPPGPPRPRAPAPPPPPPPPPCPTPPQP